MRTNMAPGKKEKSRKRGRRNKGSPDPSPQGKNTSARGNKTTKSPPGILSSCSPPSKRVTRSYNQGLFTPDKERPESQQMVYGRKSGRKQGLGISDAGLSTDSGTTEQSYSGSQGKVRDDGGLMNLNSNSTLGESSQKEESLQTRTPAPACIQTASTSSVGILSCMSQYTMTDPQFADEYLLDSQQDDRQGMYREDGDNHNLNLGGGHVDLITGASSPTNRDIIKTLDIMNRSLKGDISGVKNTVGQMMSHLSKVDKDLQAFENKWEAQMESMQGEVSTLEKNNKSLENRWELHRERQSKELSIIQIGIDSNSSAILELKNADKTNQEKWEKLEQLENKIKKAADSKFQAVKNMVQAELRVELLEEMRSTFAPNTDEIKEGIATLKEEIQEEVRANQAAAEAERQLERLKDQAAAKRNNLIVFSLAEQHSLEADTRALLFFFKDRMDLPNLSVKEVYRLGNFQMNQSLPRPLVVKFAFIQERWQVWNRKGSITKIAHNPIWIQEDLPKKLREDTRIFNRIAKAARQKPHIYQEVRIKDFKLIIDGTQYGPDDLHSLPEELQPKSVYTPRSAHSCVFFTRYSPLSNHHPSNFKIDDQSFICVEQFLALRRAQLAGDDFHAKEAMEKQDPADHKVILNSLRSNQPDLWFTKAEQYILQATRAKFTQNEDLADFLIGTHPLELGEASRNPIWGIGHSLDSTEVFDQYKWVKGGNLLGKTLVKVRDELINSYIK